MNAKARAICLAHIGTVCATGCPLRKACAPQMGDNIQAYNKRMNAAAEVFEKDEVDWPG